MMTEHRREVEQLVARRAHNPKVGGSNPSLATIFSHHHQSGSSSAGFVDITYKDLWRCSSVG